MQRRLIPPSLLQFAAGGAFAPFVFLYLSRDLNLSFPEIGQIFVISSIVNAAMPIFLGVLADRFVPVNRLLILLHTLAATSIVLLAFSTSYAAVTVWTVSWFALWQSTNGLYNAFCFHNLKSPGEEFGRVRAWGTLGWVIPLIPIWLWHHYSGHDDLRFVLFVTAAFQFSFVFCGRLMPYTRPGGKPPEGEEGVELPFLAAVRLLLRKTAFWLLILSSFCMSWSLTILFFYSPVLLKSVCDVPQKWIGPIQSAGIPLEFLVFLILRPTIRRLGYVGTLAIGSMAMVLRQLLFAYSDNLTLLTLSYALPSIAVPFFLTANSLTIEAIADRRVRASAQSIIAVVGSGLAGVIGHLHAGQTVGQSEAGLISLFVLGAALAAIPLLLLPLIHLAEGKRLGFFTPPK